MSTALQNFQGPPVDPGVLSVRVQRALEILTGADLIRRKHIDTLLLMREKMKLSTFPIQLESPVIDCDEANGIIYPSQVAAQTQVTYWSGMKEYTALEKSAIEALSAYIERPTSELLEQLLAEISVMKRLRDEQIGRRDEAYRT